MLVLDPKDRSSLKVLMQDKWINAGYAPSEQLRPYKEPPKSQLDEVRVKAMEAMGFTRADLESSVVNPEFDHVYATYHLLPETPSQFMVLCEELALGGRKSQTSGAYRKPLAGAGNQPAAVPPAPPTAIGRFTVAPSENVTDVSSRNPSVVTPMIPSIDSPANASQRKQPPYPMTDSGSREHHSLTSALPVALRKAIVQMGRTFGAGGSYNTSTPNSGSSVGPDAHQRSTTSATSRAPVRPPSKQTDGRLVIHFFHVYCLSHTTYATQPQLDNREVNCDMRSRFSSLCG
ncbi:unnamed protein product [Echinostoma caproni]|uniref:UBA domain-containing protein n=1 Tax=Echinostoma caproni TaxID=27848 RepID=A0A183AWT6_9TREM|nr:unnamed protein product [Echinostoma caproni]